MTKNELRKFALEKRKTLDRKALSEKAVKNLMSLKEYRESRNIICYYPLKYELDTRLLFEDNTKNRHLPKVKGDNLNICPFGVLKPGSFGILEPDTQPLKDYSNIDMIIIPACAADRKGFRLGYGKGYYDRFLSILPLQCKKVIIVYSELLFETVFPDKYDFKCGMIVTDKDILQIY